MIKTKKILSLFLSAILLCCTLALGSCGTKLVYDDGVFYCAKNKVTYKEVDYQYIPVSVSKEKYADLEEKGAKTELFPLEGVAPEKWLATADGRLFCSVDEKVPTFDEMEIDSILICKEGTSLTVALAEITSAESVSSILENIKNGSKLEYPLIGEAAEILVLQMASQKYPWLYYSIDYVEFSEDVCIKDYVEDMDSYTFRDVDDSVKTTVTLEYDCWYIVESDEDRETLTEIADAADIPYSSLTKPDGADGKLEYIGLLFSDCNTLEECVESVISAYEGKLSGVQLHAILDYPDIEERNNIVEYNYGKYLIYDRAMNNCVKADELLHEYKDQIRHD